MTKKKTVSFLLPLCMLLCLAACHTTKEESNTLITPEPTKTIEPTKAPDPTVTPTAASEQPPAATTKTVTPLPVTIDLNNLTDCTVAVSFEKGDAYVDDTGKMQLKVKVYTYDLYDMVDISTLTVGDTIVLRGEEVVIDTLNTTAYGAVQINGGLDVGGYELVTDNHTVYYETGYSDVKTYFELGEATVRVSQDFLFTDNSDPDGNSKTYYPGDFLIDEAGIVYFFTPHNTHIVIESGMVTQMERIYTP